MFQIYCPYCCETRAEEEFHCAGQAHISRPLSPDDCTDEQWGNYLYFRKNIRGLQQEMWLHEAGCRKYFNVSRHTVSYEVVESYKIHERPQKGELDS